MGRLRKWEEVIDVEMKEENRRIRKGEKGEDKKENNQQER